MRIVHIVYGFALGGIETMLVNISNEQAKCQHDVHIIVINAIVDPVLRSSLAQDVHFYCLARIVGSKNPLVVLRLNRLISLIHPDIIHIHNSSIAKYIFIRSLKKKLCVTQHDVCHGNNFRSLDKSKRIYAISNAVKIDIMKKTHLPSEVVLNGIRPELIAHSGHAKSDKFKIVQVSRLMHEKKGQHILIQAISKLVLAGYDNVEVDFIGEGESLQYLKDLSVSLGIDRYINFLGAKDQFYIFNNLHNYDLFVQPSIYEGFGLTVAEAMAAKVPVLVSANQGPMEIIDNGRYGYYFKSADSNDCAGKIELFLKGQNDDSMIEMAYRRVCSLYNVKVTANTYLLKYKDFIISGYSSLH